jgi:glycosyltransferase involved in cell wall biosynthesis
MPPAWELAFWLSAAVVLYAYAGYPALIALAAWLRPAPRVQKKEITPAVTLLIVVRNEEECLEEKLRNALALDYPRERLEILVASDGSTDGTEAIAARFAARGVRLLALAPGGKAAALNEAVPRAGGDILVLTDARQTLAPDAVRRLAAYFADPTVGAVSGELHLLASPGSEVDGVGLYWKYEKLLRKAESRFDSTVGVTGAFYALRKELFVPLDPRTILDDVAIPMRATLAGRRVLFAPEARAWDRVEESAAREYRRKVRTLAGNYQLVALYPALLHPLRDRLLWQLVSHKLTRLAVPWCLLVLLLASTRLSVTGAALYRAALAAQALFYLLAMTGGLCSRRWRALHLTSLPYAFVLLNVAAARALVGFLRGTETAAWRGGAARAPRVVFVLSKFPCYDEAFLLREVHAVAQRIDVWIFSLRRSRESVVHAEALALRPRTLSVPYLLSTRVLRANLALALSRPHKYGNALARLVATNRRSPEFLVKSLVFFPKAVWLAHWALDHGVTHLHAGWASYPASAALVASEISGVPFSFSGHAHDIFLDATHLPEKLRRAEFVTTCTATNRTHLCALAPDGAAARVMVVHHGLRMPGASPPVSTAGPLSVLSVGTLHPHKGFEYVVEALARLRDEGLDLRGTIVGGGPLEAALRARVARAGLDGVVTMTGALTQSEVFPHYARARVFVLMAQPEWHWGIPNVIIEALAAGNAVITTRFGSVEELVKHGETGLLVPPRDAAALAAAIRRLAEDPALRARLALAGQTIVARDFDLERSADFYVRRFQGRPS